MFIIILKMKTIDLFLVVDPTNLNMISVTKYAPDIVEEMKLKRDICAHTYIYYVVYRLI